MTAPFDAADGAAPTCNLRWIGRQLGCASYGDKRLVRYVTLLIREHGFPKPLPTLVKLQLTSDVTANSQWIRDGVEAWLEGFRSVADPAGSAASAARSAQAMNDGLILRLVGGA